MGFYWKDKKDQLFARRGNLPETDYSAWTSFEMGLREPAPLPARPLDLARFLASSITFMTNLREVSLFFNDKKLVHLTKDADKPSDVAIPRDMKATSPKRTMVVRKVTSTPLHITANVLRWVYATGSERSAPTKPPPPRQAPTSNNFFSSFLASFVAPSPSRTPEPPPVPQESVTELLETMEASVVLSVFSAQVDISLDQKMLTELERATKKRPPRTTTYSLIYVRTLLEEFSFTKVAISRLERTNTTQARNKIPLTRGMLAVFSKACELTWKGELLQTLFVTCLLHPPLAQTLLVFILWVPQTR